MNYREQLQLAAKAIGINLEITEYCSNYSAGYWTASGNIERYSWTPWDPLKDDGDAFRLAAKLGIDVIWNNSSFGDIFRYQEYLANARRAIVKAAAKIGQNRMTSAGKVSCEI